MVALIVGHGVFFFGFCSFDHSACGLLTSKEFFFDQLSPEVAPPGEHHIERRVLPEAEDEDEPDALLGHRVVPQVIQGTRPRV